MWFQSVLQLWVIATTILIFSAAEDSENYMKIISENSWTVAATVIPDNPTVQVEKPDYLYSNKDIINLAGIEAGIYDAMKKYVAKVNQRLNLMKWYIKDYEESSVNMLFSATDDEKSYALVANPILTHRLIKRFADDFVNIVTNFEEKLENIEFLEAVSDANRGNLMYPTLDDDYINSMASLTRIQRYSNITPAEMAEGKLGDLQTGIRLDAKHAYDLSVYTSDNQEDYAFAIEWLEVSLDKIVNDSELLAVDPRFPEKIDQKLAVLADKHDQACMKNNRRNREVCFEVPVGKNFGKMKPENRTRRWKRTLFESRTALNNTWYNVKTNRNFMNLCSGNTLLPASRYAKLFCWYEHKNNPYLLIGPAKFELLHDDPPIYQVYDMIGPQRTKKLIQAATPSMERSRVANFNNPKANDLRDIRTSTQTWLYDQDRIMGRDIFLMSRGIEHVTGLRVLPRNGKTASEAFQVASYRPSHHYDEHLDALTDKRRTEENGDRIATFMYYLNDVDVGGYTGFPVLGIYTKPVKGSAVFWYNLEKDVSEVDRRMFHGGCPVAHGVKWVANKWILLYQNFDKAPCPLESD